MKIEPRNYEVVPWKNGKGSTRIIAVDTETPWRWRLSWANLPLSGPFSEFAGYDRKLVLIRGTFATLIHDDQKPKLLRPFQTHSFSGDSETDCVVEIASEDFNAITLRDRAKTGVYPAHLRSGEDAQLPLSGNEHFVFCVDGEMEVRDPNLETTCELKAGETFRLSRDPNKELLNLKTRGRAAETRYIWVVITLIPRRCEPPVSPGRSNLR